MISRRTGRWGFSLGVGLPSEQSHSSKAAERASCHVTGNRLKNRANLAGPSRAAREEVENHLALIRTPLARLQGPDGSKRYATRDVRAKSGEARSRYRSRHRGHRHGVDEDRNPGANVYTGAISIFAGSAPARASAASTPTVGTYSSQGKEQ